MIVNVGHQKLAGGFHNGSPNTVIGYPFDGGFRIGVAQLLQGHLLLQNTKQLSEMDKRKENIHSMARQHCTSDVRMEGGDQETKRERETQRRDFRCNK